MPISHKELQKANERLMREVQFLRRWLLATARSLENSGLTIEQYNAITEETLKKMKERGYDVR
jgi:hypothetical protein